MACFHPLRAWRTRGGEVVLHKERPDSFPLLLPCGGCLGCRLASAKAWALRCRLELQLHPAAAFTTLTYEEKNLPLTLQKRDLQLWFKRIRKESKRKLRYFASGEYGEKHGRPHYHALLFGVDSTKDCKLVEKTWGLGRTETTVVTPSRIAYCAGYTSKKVGYMRYTDDDLVDPETGEVIGKWEAPFITMSRNPGLGSHARQWPESWRSYGITDNYKIPVPRYLHESWQNSATTVEKEELLYEKSLLQSYPGRNAVEQRERTAIAKQKISADSRHLG